MLHELFDVRAILQGLLLQGRNLQEAIVLANQARRTPLLRDSQVDYSNYDELDPTCNADPHEPTCWQFVHQRAEWEK